MELFFFFYKLSKNLLLQVIKYLAFFILIPIFFKSVKFIVKYFREETIFLADVIPIPGMRISSLNDAVLISLGKYSKWLIAQFVLGSIKTFKFSSLSKISETLK